MIGGEGNDLLDGGTGADQAAGNAGDDVYYVDGAQDVVIEQANEGRDMIAAKVSYTLPDNVETLQLLHGTQNISATGNASDNTIIGNGGDNDLAGQGGADTFRFKPDMDTGEFGHDTITDFVAGSGTGHDVIQFSAQFFSSYAAVMNHAAQVGADVVVTYDANNSLTLRGITLGSLGTADFLFG